MNLALSILVLGFLIMVHELGHFLVAKAAGVKVHEFGIGFGPKIWSTTRGETEYSLRLFIFLGGFNRMAGMEGCSDDNEADAGRRFNDKSVGQRAAIIAAGPLSNYLLAVIIFGAVFGGIGVVMPIDDQPIIGRVLPGKPAAEAGLAADDRIMSIDGSPVGSWGDLVNGVQTRLGKPTVMVVERDDRRFEVRLVPSPSDSDPRLGMIGVDSRRHLVRMGPVDASVAAVKQTAFLTAHWFRSVSQVISREAPADVAGPIGIIKLVKEASAVGPPTLLYLAGFLSITLGIMNLLPFPALDGSRLAFLAVEKVRGRPIDPNRENFIHFIGFAILMVLAILITMKDIERLIV